MPTFLPQDDNSHPIPALRLKASGGAHAISSSASSARNSTTFNANTKVVSVYATKAVYIKFGDNTVTAAATDHYFPAGIYYDIAIGGGDTGHYSNMAVLRVAEDGTVYVSEKE